MIPIWMQAGLWGLFSGGALVIGAVIGYWVQLSSLPAGSQASWRSERVS